MNNFLESGISDFVTPSVEIVSPDDSAKTVAQRVKNAPGQKVLVADPVTRRLRGVITLCDLDKLAEPQPPNTALQLATTSKLIGIRKNAQLWQALKILNGDNALGKVFSALPVLDDNNVPVGILEKDKLRRILSNITLPLSGSGTL